MYLDPDPEGKKAGGDDGKGDKELNEMRTKLGEFRDNNVALRKELDEVKDKFGKVDLAQYQKAVEFMGKIEKQQKDEEEAKLLKAGSIDEVVARRTETMKADYVKQLEALTNSRDSSVKEGETLRTKLGELLIGRDAQVELSNLGVKVAKGGLRDLMARAHSDWHLDADGNMVAERNGEKLFGKDGAPLKMKEWAEMIVDDAGHLFEGGKGGGSPGGNKMGTGNPRTVRWGDKKGFMDNLEKIAKGEVRVED
jgi:hypothetical protein